MMRPELLQVLQCPNCAGELSVGYNRSVEDNLTCLECGKIASIQGSIPLFSQPPAEMVPSEKIMRGPTIGTPWRQANWRFLQQQVDRLAPDALILDVGAGRGDFAAALGNHRCLALEVYPYPEVDVVCDLTHTNPFRPASFDAVLLLNVLEHVYDSHALLETLSGLLKPDGVLIMAIPFMVKIHQAPVDYVRFTHFALQRLGEDHGLQVDLLEGYYDPLFFLGEGVGNLHNAVLPFLHGARRRTARLLLSGIQALANSLQRLLGPGASLAPDLTKSMAPTGYQIVYRRRSVVLNGVLCGCTQPTPTPSPKGVPER